MVDFNGEHESKQSGHVSMDLGEQGNGPGGERHSSLEIAPDTGKPLNTVDKVRFATGFALVSILWMIPFAMGSGVLLPAIFKTMPGVSPEAAVGSLSVSGSVVALIANVIFGTFSDISRFRVGKRTPWVVLGGIIGAIGYVISFQTHTIFLITVGWCIVQVGINCLIAPAVAVLSDRIPQATRGTFSALYGAGQIVGQQLGFMIGSVFLTSINTGFVVGTLFFLFSGIITVVLWPREQSAANNDVKRTWRDVFLSFVPPTKNARDYYLALVGRFVYVLGSFMISGYLFLILGNYIGLDTAGVQKTMPIMSLLTMLTTIAASAVAGPLSDYLHRRKLLVAISCAIIALGMAVPFFIPTVTGMYIYATLVGIGNGCYMSVDQALNVDVLPSAKEAGKDLGILNLANTVGQTLAPMFTTAIVGIFGSYHLVFPSAVICLLIGMAIIMMIRKVK